MPGRPIALDLSKLDFGSSFDARPSLVGIVEDLVSLLETQMPDEADFPAEPLRARLKQSRMRVRTAETADDLHEAGFRLVGDASQTHARIAGHVASRESELYGVIRLLREILDALRGDARAFRTDITNSSDRVADLARIDDVRSLRKALSREVDELRRNVQEHETREQTRLEQLSGRMRPFERRLQDDEADQDRPTRLPRRTSLERRLASLEPSETCTLLLLRVDQPDAIVREHDRSVLDRVVLCLTQLLQGTFGAQTSAYRVDSCSVAVVMTGQPGRTLVHTLRQAQTRMAPEYEYEQHGTTRSVAFTFSSGAAERVSGESAGDFLHRVETLAAHAASQGPGRLEFAAARRGLFGWL